MSKWRGCGAGSNVPNRKRIEEGRTLTASALCCGKSTQNQQDQSQNQEKGPHPFSGSGQLGIQRFGFVLSQEGVGHTADGTGETGALAGLEQYSQNNGKTAEQLQNGDNNL